MTDRPPVLPASAAPEPVETMKLEPIGAAVYIGSLVTDDDMTPMGILSFYVQKAPVGEVVEIQMEMERPELEVLSDALAEVLKASPEEIARRAAE